MARDQIISVTATEKEKQVIEAAAEHQGLSTSSFVRRCALAGVVHVAEELRAEDESQQVREATG